MDRFGLVSKLVRSFWPFATTLWRDWGIQLLVTLSLFGHIFLAIFGQRRKYMASWWIWFLIWAAYLLSAYVAIIALGKLTVVQVDDPKTPGYHAELLGLLAPLLLIHLGNPDSITAFSVEDNQLGFRQLVNILSTVAFVVWVLIRCWNGNSPVSMLFIPLFFAGFLISIGWVWCLYLVYRENSGVTIENIDFSDEYESFNEAKKWTCPQGSPIKILQAFYRFDCLRPHIPNWLYHPGFVNFEHTKIDEDSAEAVFTTTEIELGFMYDVLYTKAPILYTWLGIIGRFLVVFFIVWALWGFSAIFKNTFLVDMYITYTYAILIAVLACELYQTVLIPFSDWAVVKMMRLQRNWFLARIIIYVADICIKQRRWSRTMGQLNLFKYCCQKEFWKPIGIVLWLFGEEEKVKRQWAVTRPEIQGFFKEKLHKYLKDLEKIRKQKPFNKRGDWTLERLKIPSNDILWSSIEQGFDKSIITWHIATEICSKQLNGEEMVDDNYNFVKKISDYMMYLVALRPQLLSVTTTDITMAYASEKIRGLHRDRNGLMPFKELLEDGPHPIIEKKKKGNEMKETFITKDWNVLSEARELAQKLQGMGNKWEIMGSMWVEMLCYAAYNCQVMDHAKMLWCGGELITHIWLMLLHKTDKYHTKVTEVISPGIKESSTGWNCFACRRAPRNSLPFV